MGEFLFGSAYTARIFTGKYICKPLGQFDGLFLHILTVFNYINGGIGVNIADNFGVEFDIGINLYNVLLAEFSGGGIFYKRHRTLKAVKP